MSTLIIAATTSIHFEALSALSRAVARRSRNHRLTIVVALACVIFVHLMEICIYAVAYALGAKSLHIGYFIPIRPMDSIDFFYYAAETYSALGYGDVYPTGALRLVASVSPLNGVLLLSWSGAFLFRLVQNALESNGDFPPASEK